VTQRFTIPTIRPDQSRTNEPPKPPEPPEPRDPRDLHITIAADDPPRPTRRTAELVHEHTVSARGSSGIAPARIRARGTPNEMPAPDDKLRTLIFAREPTRAGWIEGELLHAQVTIQVARRVRTVVAALTKDPPPRPELLIVDFDAISPGELFELHAIRHDGWLGRLIGLGRVPADLRASLGIDEVLAAPLVRDSLLDCVAGTRHAVVTVACPVIPPR
jgi:hypothetical protein